MALVLSWGTAEHLCPSMDRSEVLLEEAAAIATTPWHESEEMRIREDHENNYVGCRQNHMHLEHLPPRHPQWAQAHNFNNGQIYYAGIMRDLLVHFGALLFDTSTQLLIYAQINETIPNHPQFVLRDLCGICLCTLAVLSVEPNVTRIGI